MTDSFIYLVLFCHLAQACLGRILIGSSEYESFAEAVSNAKAGDTLIASPGVYSGSSNRNIVINETLTIAARDGPSTVTIDMEGDGGFIQNVLSDKYVSLRDLIIIHSTRPIKATNPGGRLEVINVSVQESQGTAFEVVSATVQFRNVSFSRVRKKTISSEDERPQVCVFVEDFRRQDGPDIENVFSLVDKLTCAGNDIPCIYFNGDSVRVNEISVTDNINTFSRLPMGLLTFVGRGIQIENLLMARCVNEHHSAGVTLVTGGESSSSQSKPRAAAAGAPVLIPSFMKNIAMHDLEGIRPAVFIMTLNDDDEVRKQKGTNKNDDGMLLSASSTLKKENVIIARRRRMMEGGEEPLRISGLQIERVTLLPQPDSYTAGLSTDLPITLTGASFTDGSSTMGPGCLDVRTYEYELSAGTQHQRHMEKLKSTITASFTRCFSMDGGGGARVDASARFHRSTFTGCGSTTSGGGLYVGTFGRGALRPSLELRECIFSDSHSLQGGGGVAVESTIGSIVIKDSQFEKSSGGGPGGCLAVLGESAQDGGASDGDDGGREKAQVMSWSDDDLACRWGDAKIERKCLTIVRSSFTECSAERDATAKALERNEAKVPFPPQSLYDDADDGENGDEEHDASLMQSGERRRLQTSGSTTTPDPMPGFTFFPAGPISTTPPPTTTTPSTTTTSTTTTPSTTSTSSTTPDPKQAKFDKIQEHLNLHNPHGAPGIMKKAADMKVSPWPSQHSGEDVSKQARQHQNFMMSLMKQRPDKRRLEAVESTLILALATSMNAPASDELFGLTMTDMSSETFLVGKGGAIYSQHRFAHFEDLRFLGNSATREGGGMYLSWDREESYAVASPPQIQLNNITFTRNIATMSGGALYVEGFSWAGTNVSIALSRFNQNRADLEGGGNAVNFARGPQLGSLNLQSSSFCPDEKIGENALVVVRQQMSQRIADTTFTCADSTPTCTPVWLEPDCEDRDAPKLLPQFHCDFGLDCIVDRATCEPRPSSDPSFRMCSRCCEHGRAAASPSKSSRQGERLKSKLLKGFLQ